MHGSNVMNAKNHAQETVSKTATINGESRLFREILHCIELQGGNRNEIAQEIQNAEDSPNNLQFKPDEGGISMEFNTLIFNVQSNVAHITLNRPNAANSINLELAQELAKALMNCDEETEIRAVLITGAGPMFCAGGDLKSFAAQGDKTPYHLKEVTTYLHIAISCLVRMEPPAIAAVHGSAAGAGMSLASACDIVLADESARFTMAYTRVGLTPDGGSTYFLSRLVGLKRALELTLTNRVLSAREALDWGIVTRVVPDKDLKSSAQALAFQLAAGPTKAFGTSKRLFQMALNESLEGQMKHESHYIAEMARTEDGREGVSAFLQKRPPKFVRQ